jgi:hypothetical protein
MIDPGSQIPNFASPLPSSRGLLSFLLTKAFADLFVGHGSKAGARELDANAK